MNLEERLNQVSDKYEDFVPGALMLSEKFGVQDVLEGYLDKNREATSSDVYSFLFDYCGLEPLPVVDD